MAIELPKERGLVSTKLILKENTLQIGDTVHEITRKPSEKGPGEGVTVQVLEFTDPEIAKAMDAAEIIVAENKSTPPQVFLAPRIWFESVVEGDGYWVGVNSKGDSIIHHFSANDPEDNRGAVIYGGDSDGPYYGRWYAGPKGLTIIEVCFPPYTEDGLTISLKPGENTHDGKTVPDLILKNYSDLNTN